jgi:hypothetical protein
MLLGLLAGMSLFYGYWQLNRTVSLSPVETGRALASVIMSEPKGELDMNAEGLLQVIGHKKSN